MSNYDEIERLFSQLLAAVTPVLSESERSEVQRFIDVGEYGLALETAVEIFADERVLASTDMINLIKRLAVAMSMDPEVLVQQLPRG
jgi:hypothetical protein